MKIAPARLAAFLARPDEAVRVVLLFGNDAGLVRERGRALVTAVAGDPPDPFRLAELNGREVAEDAARLVDEAAQLSLVGGRRAVRVRDADDGAADAVSHLLDKGRGDALVVLEGAAADRVAALRRLCERHPSAAAVACWLDDGAGLDRLIREQLGAAGLAVAPDALAFLGAHLGADRLVTRAELDKLALYAHGQPRVELADAVAAVGDAAAIGLDDLALAAADGDAEGAVRALDRALAENVSAIAIVRALLRHVARLHQAAVEMRAGRPAEAAMAALRPPVFFKATDRFRRQLRQWRPGDLAAMLDRLVETEAACKRTGAPTETLVGEAVQALALTARRAGRPGAQGMGERPGRR